MPYINGKGVTQDEKYRLEKWEASHQALTRSANIMFVVLMALVFLSGIIGIVFVLYNLITSGDMGLCAIGWLATASLIIATVLSLFYTRFEV